MKSLGEIATYVGVQPPHQHVSVTGLTLATASIAQGDLFIALPGAHTHGARFADAAIAAGAVGVITDPAGAALLGASEFPVVVRDELRPLIGSLASWFYDHPSEQMQVLGITGTNGKTTSTYLLDAALRAGGHRTGLIGTVETRIGERCMTSARTTPEAPDLQRLFAEMVQEKVSAVSMEVSSHALQLGRVSGTRFAVSAFTNLSQDHLDFHGSMEEYFRAKAMLFTEEYSASALICVDDEYGQRLIREIGIPALAVSTSGVADWWLSDIESHRSGSTATLHTPENEQFAMSVNLPGRYNLTNALVAIACAVNAGVEVTEAVAGVSSCAGVPGRMERIDVGQPFTVVVDYAHTPDAVASVLAEVRLLTSGRVITVLGCGGDRDAGKRPAMGLAAAVGSDLAIFTNDNPRSEDPMEILEAMRRGADQAPNAQVVVEPDRRQAIALAIQAALPEDIVVIAGKGHEQGQEIAGQVRPFDDRDEARLALVALGGGQR